MKPENSRDTLMGIYLLGIAYRRQVNDFLRFRNIELKSSKLPADIDYWWEKWKKGCWNLESLKENSSSVILKWATIYDKMFF